ncbi:conserved hypothetical protein [Mesorhizobium plurifarium]|uniref:Cthe-2314-like HEPN domain-containing protein n=1 Tax=Mesorhizobium plurifarium TaxID=69974 RepID=A0A090DN16_MESPL|nr:conserved hypothetical protein [Mesorhizobium plurifarium]
MTPDEDLEYEKHITFYRSMGLLSGQNEQDTHFYFEAQENHALSVIDALGDLQIEIVSIGQKLEMGDAYYHLVFGAGRRSRMIWGAVRQLHGLIPPNRTEPLLHDDAFEAARALNDIYIHARGILDNYAWALIFLFGEGVTAKLHQNDASLFGRKFLSLEILSDFHKITTKYAAWNRELKERRDPVAHRIPLSVPPAMFDEDDQSRYREITDLYNAAQRQFFESIQNRLPQSEIESASAEVEAINDLLQRIGKFVPLIIHDPNDGGVRIYPTVPQDIGMLVKLVRALNRRINERLAA